MSLTRTRAEELLAAFHDQRILVVGDLMLDRYIYGQVDRISPEAPVPVVRVTRQQDVPGGASNVASNIRSLGGGVAVSGILGNDHSADDLKRLLSEEGVQTDGILYHEGARTTVKTRIIADRQQVVRMDWDAEGEISEDLIDQYCEKVADEVAHSTGVILEDYGKGVIQQPVVDAVLSAAKDAGIPSGFDPKGSHHLYVSGVTIATPNRREAFVAAGTLESKAYEDPLSDTRLLRVAETLLDKWGPELLLITLGPQGMLLMSQAGKPLHVPTRAQEVFDVSGAGDTVVAACLLALSAGATHAEAAELANTAASVVVGKLGTATCSPKEWLESFS